MTVFDDLESNVRYYCRRWPVVFIEAHGALIIDESRRQYIDFFSGAGALSYGHNNPVLVEAAVAHLRSGALLHSLDLHTPEKRAFLEALRDRVMTPRGLEMVVQFVGPTGATAVEAALELAFRVTGRRTVLAFEGGYHGMTDRTASISAALDASIGRSSRGVCTFLPYVESDHETAAARLETVLRASGDAARPGALIIEPTQGEGGARPFADAYLAEVRRLCTLHHVVLIADEVQSGIGRTGPFFSFEGSGLAPDIICLSKSLSGLGLPLALNLVRRDFDLWMPGEFSGTFRGNNLAFVTATAVLEHYWADDHVEHGTVRRGEIVGLALDDLATSVGGRAVARGKGLLRGLDVVDAATAAGIADAAFERGLLVETCGSTGSVVKVLPPLLISDHDLIDGLGRLADAVQCTLADHRGVA